MKSWNGPAESAPLIAPPRSPGTPASAPAPAAGDRIRIRALVYTVVTCVFIFGFDSLFPDVKNGYPPRWSGPPEPAFDPRPFEWSQIKPSKTLKFHKCFGGGFECAKLEVPLDYFNGTYPNETVSIAISKLPAKVPVDDPRYVGPILLNPGGPGGPGALFAIAIGQSLQDIVDSEKSVNIKSDDAKYYDIIGFDPRGIGETEPRAVCNPDLPTSWSYNLRMATEGILGSSDAALGRLWVMLHAWGRDCKQIMDDEDGPDIKQYISTAFVARDMLEIVERHAAYVADKVAQLNPKTEGRLEPAPAVVKPSEAKLDYWGFSYGTFLGSTFASMYPDRVGRVVLDGVVSSWDYNHSLGNGSLTDNQKAVNTFYTYCVAAGPESCPLTTANSTAADVEDRVQSIIQSLYHNPLALNASTGPEILTYSDVKTLLFSAAYSPQSSWPQIAELLSEIEVGHGEIIDMISDAFHFTHVYSCSADGSSPADYANYVPTFAILCSDGDDQANLNIDEFSEYWDLLESLSPTAGAIWSMLKMRCASWNIKASYKFEGPFGGKTSNPILFVSNTADPVTPLRSGRLMHSFFPGSGLLTIDTAGHCSLTEPTSCSLKHIKNYYQTGALPTPNTLCIPPPSPWSLNSTDPNSPFYDPTLGEMQLERTQSLDQCMQECDDVADMQILIAGNSAATTVTGLDYFGLGKLTAGGTHLMDKVRRGAAYKSLLPENRHKLRPLVG